MCVVWIVQPVGVAPNGGDDGCVPDLADDRNGGIMLMGLAADFNKNSIIPFADTRSSPLSQTVIRGAQS